MITPEQVKNNPSIRTYIQKADESLIALGYTEHSFAHVGRVASEARRILLGLGRSQRQADLAEIAGYLHDIGNIINRVEHAQSGAIMAFRLLDNMGMEPAEIAEVICAIGNHDEGTAEPVNDIAAALILADKTDVRNTRVRNKLRDIFDIHDRVNWSVQSSELELNPGHGVITLLLTIDTEVCSVMEYFEIFIGRMMLCRKAAQRLGLRFRIIINGQTIL
ncbi:MAG: HD domain-containing protein [Clostridia bacterium]|nr:HD domain-containing protein [Candidatus Pelethousia sp.]NCB30669.1 HD domain-containing protein [Clostridia bacterium]